APVELALMHRHLVETALGGREVGHPAGRAAQARDAVAELREQANALGLVDRLGRLPRHRHVRPRPGPLGRRQGHGGEGENGEETRGRHAAPSCMKRTACAESKAPASAGTPVPTRLATAKAAASCNATGTGRLHSRMRSLTLSLLLAAAACGASQSSDTTAAAPAEEPAAAPAPSEPAAPAIQNQASEAAERGATLYGAKCASCHGDAGQGKKAPALVGKDALPLDPRAG